LAFFVGLIFLGFLRSKAIVIAFVVLAIVFYIFSPQKVKDAITSTLSFKDRIEMWKNSGEMLKDKPIQGFGLNTFYENYKYYRKDKFKYKKGSYAHNCYLQQAVEVGIPGLLIFLYLLFSIFKIPFKIISKAGNKFSLNLALGIWIGLFNFCIYAFFDTNFYSLPLVILFWFMAGLLFSTQKIYKNAI
ncbi:MAG: O-antigen ligase family protein, partial [Candidatus Omnitrophica bacterium]|nr:O-antigen ligase family protein [Candidatus Omnitrophota bacterium]